MLKDQVQDLLSSRWSMGQTVDVDGVLLFLFSGRCNHLIPWPFQICKQDPRKRFGWKFPLLHILESAKFWWKIRVGSEHFPDHFWEKDFTNHAVTQTTVTIPFKLYIHIFMQIVHHKKTRLLILCHRFKEHVNYDPLIYWLIDSKSMAILWAQYKNMFWKSLNHPSIMWSCI